MINQFSASLRGIEILILSFGLNSCAVFLENQNFPAQDTPTSVPSQLSNSNAQANVAMSSEEIGAIAQDIHQQINQYRQSQNLPTLQLNPTITQQAQQHSQEMATGQVPFSHQGFEQRAEKISQAVQYRSVAENVAYNQGYSDPAENAVSGWLKSPGHYKNIVGDFNLTGIGVAQNEAGEYYFTQIFVKQR